MREYCSNMGLSFLGTLFMLGTPLCNAKKIRPARLQANGRQRGIRGVCDNAALFRCGREPGVFRRENAG
jgi:hypothetical protein